MLSAVAVVAIISLGALNHLTRQADRIRMASNMRALGSAILGYAADHDGRLPGPLWPGQIVEYHRGRPGRLVVELAAYLQIEDREQPYLVEKFFTSTLRRAAKGVSPSQLRVFVMNTKLESPTGAINPWGSLASPQPGKPLSLAALQPRFGQPGFWEADRSHPDVAAAPWATFTVPAPAHGHPRLAWYFDGSVGR